MPDKLILSKENGVKGHKPALLEIDTHAALKELSAETGISISRLITKCVFFALEHAVVVDPMEHKDGEENAKS